MDRDSVGVSMPDPGSDAHAMTRSWRSSRPRRERLVRRLLARIDRWLDDHDQAITRAQGVFLVGVFVWLVWAAGHVALGW